MRLSQLIWDAGAGPEISCWVQTTHTTPINLFAPSPTSRWNRLSNTITKPKSYRGIETEKFPRRCWFSKELKSKLLIRRPPNRSLGTFSTVDKKIATGADTRRRRGRRLVAVNACWTRTEGQDPGAASKDFP